ncbi:MAG: T9SS type A sorting domain-containing protein [Flavobacteriales bacterium]|nr:T9SS type A sorting domain-containing protein [Flavobacteriales bacterium]
MRSKIYNKLSTNQLVTFLMLLISCTLFSQDWQHVGPMSSNLEDVNGQPNLFHTSQINWIRQNPNVETHMFTGGKFAGIWESFDGGDNWTAINSTDALSGGIADIAFINTNEILVGTFYNEKRTSGRVARYNFSSDSWTLFSAIPHPAGTSAIITDVEVDPFNQNVFYVCTTRGLYRGVLNVSSVTWTKIESGWIENMIIVKDTPTTAVYTIAGSSQERDFSISDINSTLIFKNSTDGINYTNVAITIPAGNHTYTAEHGFVAKGHADNQVYLKMYRRHYVTCSTASGYASDLSVYGIEENAGVYSIYTNIATLNYSCFDSYHPVRTAMVALPGYPTVVFGSLSMFSKNNDGTNGPSMAYMHPDHHDYQIYEISGTEYFYAANDGGLWRCEVPSSGSFNFETINNGLHVNLVNGFSGAATNPNYYVIGGQDITYTDFFDATEGRNRYTRSTWENDGGWFDRFNDDFVIFDHSSYGSSPNYHISEDGGATDLTNSSKFLRPLTTSPFKGDYSDDLGTNLLGFTPRLYFQDPFRPGRIFHAKHRWGVMQMAKSDDQTDPDKYYFVRKVDLGKLTPTTGEWTSNWSAIMAMSFSQQTANAMYFTTEGARGNQGSKGNAPLVIKYIGDNLDNCWEGHYEHTTSGGDPQWANLTLNVWDNLSGLNNCSTCTDLQTDLYDPTSNIFEVKLHLIETSPWDRNVVYVLVELPGSGNEAVKVMKYDGTNWSNYSEGIPTNEVMSTMIMDNASNDGLYVGTKTGKIYYRTKDDSQWVEYLDQDLPRLTTRQLEINYMENTIRVGLYGRGIWKSPLMCPTVTNPVTLGSPIPADFYFGSEVVANSNAIQSGEPTIFRGTESVTWEPGFIASGSSTVDRYALAFIHGCNTAGTSEGWKNADIDSYIPSIEDIAPQSMDFVELFPNPSQGSFDIKISNGQEVEQLIMTNMVGEYVSFEQSDHAGNIHIALNDPKTGVYILSVHFKDGTKSVKRIVVSR